MSAEYVTINFGPQNQYSLSLPITAQNKFDLETQLKLAADAAAKKATKNQKSIKQMVFDFCCK